jgi:hypothetical protein
LIIGEIKALVELVNIASGWLQQALGRAKRQRDREAAQTLYDAFVLVASMRAYDNAFRPLLGRILTFTLDWEPHRRQTTADEVVLFLDQEQILPYFRQAYGSLRGSLAMEEDQALSSLLDCAHRFTFIVEADFRTKETYYERQQVLTRLLYATSEEEASWVRAWAEVKVNQLNRRLLADADEAFAELRQRIIATHDLPDPGFAVGLPRTGGSA